MSAREQAIRQARSIISDDQLVGFFRAIRNEDRILAIRLINDHLDQGESLDAIFYTGKDFGFLLSAQGGGASNFEVSFGCQAGLDIGDGGDWKVRFDERGHVVSIENRSSWIS